VSSTAPLKAPDAFRTISEVAGDLDLPQHVLRFWETRFTQIKPMKRGGGRRYYRPEDVNLLRGIRLLLYSEGYTIRGVQRLLKEKGAGFVAAYGENGSAPAPALPDEALLSTPDVAAEPAAPSVPSPAKAGFRAPPQRTTADERQDEASAPQPRARTAAAPRPAPVSVGGRRRIEGVLAELVEAKRLLDQAR